MKLQSFISSESITGRLTFGIVTLVLVGGFWLIATQEEPLLHKNAQIIRLGWQVPWATQGQLVQVMKHTDILNKNDLNVQFTGFDHGGPLNEAALAGQVDILFTADQPAATLLSKDPNWSIVGRLMYNRVSLYVPPNSTVQSIKDLKGKTVAMPFGAAAQRYALRAFSDAGLNPQKDIKTINLGIYEQSDLVQSAKASAWGNIDAMAGFDPTPAIFEEKGLVRTLGTGSIVSVIVVSNELLERDPQAVVRFLRSFAEAYEYYRTHTMQADQWFVEESHLDITAGALAVASAVEPNLRSNGSEDMRFDLNDQDYITLQEAADFIYNQGFVQKQVDMKSFVDLTYLEQALKK
jgi:ABC-type nitrate/sulfonate/bicarbonate transport system substrate-binding protein